jgi:hypothetical protein
VLKIYLRATAEIESALSSLTQEQRSRVEDYMHARKSEKSVMDSRAPSAIPYSSVSG